MIPTSVSVFLDYQCNFACDHCSVGSSPETKFEMPEEVWENVFNELVKLDTLEMVCFTGGEVTLHKDRLLDAIERVSDAGIGTRIVTNAWWAHDMDSARDMLDDLVDAGLDEINTSYDDFHTEYMEFTNTKNLVEASLEYDGLDNIALACIIGNEDPDYDLDRMNSELTERLGEHPDDVDRLHTIEDAAAPLGSGIQLDPSRYSAQMSTDIGCRDVISTFSIHPDASVKICCGHAQFYTPDLTMGNLNDDSLVDIIENGQDNLVYWLIHEVGPKRLIDRMEVDPDVTYTGICHACDDLLGKYREEFFDYVRNNRRELIRDDVLLTDRNEQQIGRLADNRDEIMSQLDDLDPSDFESAEHVRS